MTGPEKGYLLLTSQLGDPERKPLSVAQLRKLANRVAASTPAKEDRDLTLGDIQNLGYTPEDAGRILGLLEEKHRLRSYLQRAEDAGCIPLPRPHTQYPRQLIQCLGLDAPGCLWAKGDLSLLATDCVSLVGSRDLMPENYRFAQAAGIAAAEQGYTLVSGNARGADKVAQESCLAAGGKVISVVADSLRQQACRENVLYLSLEDFDSEFSAQRALRRNAVIHCMGTLTLVAQCNLEKGGTWNGTVQNLRHGWSAVCCFRDGSEASEELTQRGAQSIGLQELQQLEQLGRMRPNFL